MSRNVKVTRMSRNAITAVTKVAEVIVPMVIGFTYRNINNLIE